MLPAQLKGRLALSRWDAQALHEGVGRCAVPAGSDSEEEPPQDNMRMTFLGHKHSKPQQRGVLSSVQDDQPVSAGKE